MPLVCHTESEYHATECLPVSMQVCSLRAATPVPFFGPYPSARPVSSLLGLVVTELTDNSYLLRPREKDFSQQTDRRRWSRLLSRR